MLKTALYCLKKLSLRHFCREGRENLNIRILMTKFWVKSACEDAPQVVPAWSALCHSVTTVSTLTTNKCQNAEVPKRMYGGSNTQCVVLNSMQLFSLVGVHQCPQKSSLSKLSNSVTQCQQGSRHTHNHKYISIQACLKFGLFLA